MDVAPGTTTINNLTLSGTLGGTGTLVISAVGNLRTMATAAMVDAGTTIVSQHATFDIEGGMFIDRNITNWGTARCFNPTARFEGGSFTNQGIIDLLGDGSFVLGPGPAPVTELVNRGFVVKSAGPGSFTIEVTFINEGGVQVSSGTLKFARDVVQRGGLSGTYLLGGNLDVLGSFDIQAGSLVGYGSIRAVEVINGGVLTVGGSGGIGTLFILGNFRQTATGILEVEIGDLGQYDSLVIQATNPNNGIARLGGTLSVRWVGGVPPPGLPATDYVPLNYGSREGVFDFLDLPTSCTVAYYAYGLLLSYSP
jgi:hypothetical protein